MPIYERSYLSWEGQLLDKPRTWWIIGRTGVRLAWKKSVALLLILAAVPFIFRAGQIYLSSRMGNTSFLAELAEGIQIDAGFFMSFMKDQTFLLLLILIVCGAGLIANDRKFKALPIYFSKPVGFWDYLIGKFLVIVCYGGVITVIPAILLFIGQILLTGTPGYFSRYYYVPFSILGLGAATLVTLGGIMLVLSALSRGTRSAAIIFFALVYIPEMLRRIFSGMNDWGWISIRANILQLGAILFGLRRPYPFPGCLAFLSLAVVTAACLAVLRHQIRPTEVVK
ncbi:MAG: ABC transporter permease subunit [Candidatus Krumholzibacteriota bacterium]|nr:ABC transporter permease subunit [Candidatus Krumholzibacteriota bacterium]